MYRLTGGTTDIHGLRPAALRFPKLPGFARCSQSKLDCYLPYPFVRHRHLEHANLVKYISLEVYAIIHYLQPTLHPSVADLQLRFHVSCGSFGQFRLGEANHPLLSTHCDEYPRLGEPL